MMISRILFAYVLVGVLWHAIASSTAAQEVVRLGTIPQGYNEIRKEIEAGYLDAALEKIITLSQDDAHSPFLINLRISIGTALLKKGRSMEAIEQAKSALDSIFKSFDDPNAARLIGPSVQTAMEILDEAGQNQEANTWLEDALRSIVGKQIGLQFGPYHMIENVLVKVRAHRLASHDRRDEAIEVLTKYVERAEELLRSNQNQTGAVIHAMTSLQNLLALLHGEAIGPVFERFNEVASQKMKLDGDYAVLVQYYQSTGNFINRICRDEPEVAEAVFASAKRTIESSREWFPKSLEQVDSILKAMERTRMQIESGKRILKMIGTPAPRFDSMAWVHGEPRESESFRGKVLLLDFWAVWCGPCVATFPHLKHLHTTYGPRGLQIVGVTRQYGYKWDEETAKARPSTEPVSMSEEVSMLERFVASHDLPYPTLVTPEGSGMNREYGVTGIPHVVVIDRGGLIRMIKVGSGDENAQAIETMIQKLLEE